MAWDVRNYKRENIDEAYSKEYPYFIQGNTGLSNIGTDKFLWLEMDLGGEFTEQVDDFYPSEYLKAVRGNNRAEAIGVAKRIYEERKIQTRVWNLRKLKIVYISPEV